MNPRSRIEAASDWYRDAVMYEVHVRAFADSNGDGIGDFVGLTSRIDYLRTLGVSAIWLLPFYPSPLRDDGYDIAEYFDVHPSYGTLEEFREFLDAAHACNMRVITELVINHTSDQHPWFQRARRAEPGSPERDFYVWSDTPEKYQDVRIIFQDTESSNWAWDPVAGAYYWHRFFSHQPDLNYDNPLVRDAIIEVLDFWLDMGVDGLRLDAIPYLYEREGTNGENLPETHAELKRLRSHLDAKYPDRMLLAEANQWPEDSVEYFGDGDECHMAFHFPLMPRLYLALQYETRFPIVDILEQTPAIPADAQWAIFLRNHDELTLEMVTEEERDLMWRTYAPDRRARLNMGIRRRLAPLLENDRRRIELLFGLLFSLPGTPVLYYGDEIGMGDNIFLADRDGVRTPMQWNSDRNAGFSVANRQSLYLPIVVDPQFHYETVNVDAQNRNPNSQLSWVRRMIRSRHRHPVFGRGDIEFLSPDNPHVLAFLREGDNETILVVANLSRHAQFVELDLSMYSGANPVELLSGAAFPVVGELPYLLTLTPYGFFWFVVQSGVGAEPPHDGPVMIEGNLDDAFDQGSALLEHVVRYIEAKPWYRGAGRRRINTAVPDIVAFAESEDGWRSWVLFVDIEYSTGVADRYVVPISFEIIGPEADEDSRPAIANVIYDGGQGALYDAFYDHRFVDRLLADHQQGRTILGQAGTVVFHPVVAHSAVDEIDAVPLDATETSASVRESADGETYLHFGSEFTVKVFRTVEPGINPDVELRRFLTERTSFENLAEVLGSSEYQSGDVCTFGVLERTLSSDTDAFEEMLTLCSEWLSATAEVDEPAWPTANRWATAEHAPPKRLAKGLEPTFERVDQLGRLTAELHQSLGSLSEDPELRPLPFSSLYQQSLYQSLRANVRYELAYLRASDNTWGWRFNWS